MLRSRISAIALRHRTVRAFAGLAQRQAGRRKRRAQIVRERVDDVTNDFAALRKLVVLFRKLIEQTRLTERDDGGLGKGAKAQ